MRMIKGMRGLAALLVLLAGTTPAFADSISTNLTFWNEAALNTAGDYVTATLSRTGTTGNYTSLSFLFVNANAISPTGVTVDKLGWNGSVGVSTCPAGWDCNGSVNSQAGFGNFSQFETLSPAPQGTGVTSSVLFGLANGGVLNFSSLGTMIAHVRYTDGCSGFVGTTAPQGGASGTSCGTVPEPSSLLLLGFGVLGFGLWQWRATKRSV